MKDLIEGYKSFRNEIMGEEKAAFEELIHKGQRPKVLVIACSDSRIDPALVLKCKPGDLFVIRNVANLVPTYEEDQSYHGTSAALQFAICNLSIQHIILFGHTQCGGMQALLEQSSEICKEKGFIAKWLELAKPAYERVSNDHQNEAFDKKVDLCGQYSLINSLNNLQTFPWIKERVATNQLSLYAWNFVLDQGVIESYDKKTGSFKEIV